MHDDPASAEPNSMPENQSVQLVLGEDGAPVGIQANIETGHCRSFSDVWRQFIPRSGRTYSKNRFPPGKMKTWLIDLEVAPSEVTCSWRFKELLRRQVQVTVEQLIHRD